MGTYEFASLTRSGTPVIKTQDNLFKGYVRTWVTLRDLLVRQTSKGIQLPSHAYRNGCRRRQDEARDAT